MTETKKISRRKLLIGGASLIGVSALTCVGGGGLAMQQPEISFHHSSYGNTATTNDNVLVAYASHAGSTGEIAGTIGQVISEAGTMVDVRQIQTISDLTPYQAVVIGSAIQSDAWLPEAVTFVKTHRDVLSQLPVAYFLSCLTLAVTNTDDSRYKVAGFLDPIHQQFPEVQPIDLGLFAGKLDFSKLPFAYRVMWPFTAGGQTGEGDYRDWEAMKIWAENISPALLAG